MDRESRHEIFNRLNYEWKGKPQTCWGPDDNERFRSGVQTNGRVWPGINRQLDPRLISQVLPWFDLSQKWIEVEVPHDVVSRDWRFRYEPEGFLASRRPVTFVRGTLSSNLMRFEVRWSCSYLSWPALSGSSQFMQDFVSSKLKIPPDIVKLRHAALLFSAGTF